jgi:hypothetical protein
MVWFGKPAVAAAIYLPAAAAGVLLPYAALPTLEMGGTTWGATVAFGVAGVVLTAAGLGCGALFALWAASGAAAVCLAPKVGLGCRGLGFRVEDPELASAGGNGLNSEPHGFCGVLTSWVSVSSEGSV